MPHVPGHIESPAQSFGALHAVNELTKEASNFPILFAPSPFEPTGTKNTAANAIDVGFLPYLIPWKSEDKEFLVIASDLIEAKAHKKVEGQLVEKINSHRKTSGYATGKPIKRLEELHETPDEIMEVIPEFNEKDREIVRNTYEYLKTDSFRKIYLDDKNNPKEPDKVIDWIEKNAVSLETIGFKVENYKLAYKPSESLSMSRGIREGVVAFFTPLLLLFK